MQKLKIFMVLAVTAALILMALGVAYAHYVYNQPINNADAPYTADTDFWGWFRGCLGFRRDPYDYSYQPPSDGPVEPPEGYVPPGYPYQPQNPNQGYYPYRYGRGCWGWQTSQHLFYFLVNGAEYLLISIYCKTIDCSKKVGELLCRANSEEEALWILRSESEEGSWLIETNCSESPSIMVSQIGGSVVVIEVDDECASKVIEFLMEKYGFENVKWMTYKQALISFASGIENVKKWF